MKVFHALQDNHVELYEKTLHRYPQVLIGASLWEKLAEEVFSVIGEGQTTPGLANLTLHTPVGPLKVHLALYLAPDEARFLDD